MKITNKNNPVWRELADEIIVDNLIRLKMDNFNLIDKSFVAPHIVKKINIMLLGFDKKLVDKVYLKRNNCLKGFKKILKEILD